jgi:hypothetical protein
MPDLLFDPSTWVMAIVIVGAAIVAGLMRHESWRAIAGTAVGASAFLVGMRWAGTVGDEAFWAAALATCGFGVWTAVAGWSRRHSPTSRAEASS